ncbi:meiotic recombination protein REC8 homolog isoform X2 [Sapajus apella]|uniref:Meiotic recombination protein REC8 homolog isoform X2 n=1 Tax=Sapajus apella TaxID=9515 RepID=A0A6J3GT52_SAPAP|nr:meiotic recombination protein REC8 homolog isoform X2 [Sapajus apella]
MFYYPNVLQRHTGCFATIWLAATRGSRLVKREYLRVNVVKTCEEILNYVLVRVQPLQPGLPRPRFSLYLSAQLQIGVIRVYSQQCQYLVEDIQHILERIHRAQLQIRIDMETELPSLLLPNHLAMMETLEDAPDPFFGMMSVDPRLPSPFDIPQIRHLLEAAPPERVEEIPPEVPTEPRKPDRILVTVLPPEAITLQEAEPIRMLQIEGERDIPEVSRRDLDLLIAEEDEAILLEARRLQQLRARLALEEAKEEPRVPEGEIIVPRISPPAPAEVEGIAEPLPVQALVPEELRPTGWEPEALLMEVTPPEELRLPVPPSPERRPPVPPPPPRRRRQLLFWDKETQISREKFRKQLQTRAHCRECPMVQPPERTIISPAELFRTPTLCKNGRGWARRILKTNSSFLVLLIPQTLCLLPACPQLAGYPLNYWAFGLLVPSHSQEHSGESCLRRLLRGRQLLRKKERLKLQVRLRSQGRPGSPVVPLWCLQSSPWRQLKRRSPVSASSHQKNGGPWLRWSSQRLLHCLWCLNSPRCLWRCLWCYLQSLSCSHWRLCTGQWHWSCRPTGSPTLAAWCHLSAPAGWLPGSSTCSWCSQRSRFFAWNKKSHMVAS